MSNNNYVLISSLNNQIQVLDLISEQEVSKYTGHKNSQYEYNYFSKMTKFCSSLDLKIINYTYGMLKMAQNIGLFLLITRNRMIGSWIVSVYLVHWICWLHHPFQIMTWLIRLIFWNYLNNSKIIEILILNHIVIL